MKKIIRSGGKSIWHIPFFFRRDMTKRNHMTHTHKSFLLVWQKIEIQLFEEDGQTSPSLILYVRQEHCSSSTQLALRAWLHSFWSDQMYQVNCHECCHSHCWTWQWNRSIHLRLRWLTNQWYSTILLRFHRFPLDGERERSRSKQREEHDTYWINVHLTGLFFALVMSGCQCLLLFVVLPLRLLLLLLLLVEITAKKVNYGYLFQ